uniref:Alliin lyase n=1 Tax=Allium cepa TaxID=4679 RepID=ALLN_ALLCE|nr:RecName: Full=Alliin lyase; Short=Alliinase; AltName: Full=Cysteine sulphoxide lyase; Flags: Precursor [Allium cepa]
MESYDKVGSNKVPCLLILTCIIMSSFVNNNIVQAKVSWSLKAAEEAEAVANINCSGHGRAFLDGILSDGSPKCECNTCYTGADCSEKITGCSADVASGDGLFLEEYWQQHKENSAVLVSGWHRMSYFFNPVSNFISFELEKTIKELHEIVGNAAAKDRYIVFGVGVTQLIHGLVISLSPNMTATPCAPQSKVVAHAPYYPVFREQTKYFDKKGYEWKGNAADYVNTSTPEQFIEMVTSPNNPEGLLRHEVIKGCKSIYYMVYYWPHYTPIKYKADEDIMLFTMSKYTGHSGSRFGWALIKDETVYNKLLNYMTKNTEGTSRETQLRSLKILKEVIAMVKTQNGTMRDLNTFGFQKLRERWVNITALLDKSDRFSYQKLPQSEYCNYFRRMRPPSPSYAWVKCEWEEDKDCYQTFQNGRINTQSGEGFEAGSRYVRLSLIKTKDDFDQLMYYLKIMVEAKRKTPLIKQLSNDQISRRPFI